MFVPTRMKLGLFLFLQLNDGTLISGYLLSWRTSHPLCVCPLRMRRGLNHCSSWGEKPTSSSETVAAALHHRFHHRHHLPFLYFWQQPDFNWMKPLDAFDKDKAVWWHCGVLTLWEASLDNTSYFSLNSRCRSSGGAASCPVQLASLTLYRG